MSIDKVLSKIPASKRDAASNKLVDIILSSPNAEKMPNDLAKNILRDWQEDQLASEVGLRRLLEASMILEPEKTASAAEELGLKDVVSVLRKS